MGDVINFEMFKGQKALDDEYLNDFLPYVERKFGSPSEPKEMIKRLFYAVRYLQGVVQSFFIMNALGFPLDTVNEGKNVLREWLKEIIEDLK